MQYKARANRNLHRSGLIRGILADVIGISALIALAYLVLFIGFVYAG